VTALAPRCRPSIPDRPLSPITLADAVEVAGRIERRAVARGGKLDPTAIRARDLCRRAQARLAALQGDARGMWAARADLGHTNGLPASPRGPVRENGLSGLFP
jgi:hypothetical protein